MITPDIIAAAKAVATAEGIEPAALLAFVQVESGGQPYEEDGKTPIILCEPYQFWNNLPASARTEAAGLGLAASHWDPHGYRDQGTSAGRLARFARMCAFDEAAAYRSVSMGLLQIMGSNAQACGYADAHAMFEAMSSGGAAEMLRAGVAFMRHGGILPHLAAHDWVKVALAYNGAGERRNNYDSKLAAAYAHWHVALASGQIVPSDGVTTLSLGNKGAAVQDLQKALTAKGYFVRIDGKYGPKVMAAVASFQVHNGLPADGICGPNTRKALDAAAPLPEGSRETATMTTLATTSRIVKGGWRAKRAIEAAGAVGVIGQNVSLDSISGALDKIDSAQTTYGRLTELAGKALAFFPHIALSPATIGVAAAVVVAWGFVHAMESARVDDEHTGATT